MRRRATFVLVLWLAVVSAAHGAPSARVDESFAAYRGFLASGGALEDPALFTAGSRVHLARTARTPGREAARLAALDAAGPLRLVVVGDRAALLPRDRRSETRPVLLERVAGKWRIDVVEEEKSLEPAERGLRLRYAGTPYVAVLRPRYAPAVEGGELAPLDLFGEDPAAAIARLEAVPTPASRLRLAEILLRNCWLLDAAMPLYEEALRGAPEPWPVARTFGYRALAAGLPDRAIPLLEKYEPAADRLLALLHARAGRFDVSQRYRRRALGAHLEERGLLERVPAAALGPGRKL